MNLGRIALYVLAAFGVFFLLRTILRLRGLSPEAIADLKSRGARVLDVRTRAEFASGHALGSVNIPLDQLEGRLQELDRGKPLIVVCATGSRSAFAKTLLERAGFPEVANGGPWQRVS